MAWEHKVVWFGVCKQQVHKAFHSSFTQVQEYEYEFSGVGSLLKCPQSLVKQVLPALNGILFIFFNYSKPSGKSTITWVLYVLWANIIQCYVTLFVIDGFWVNM